METDHGRSNAANAPDTGISSRPFSRRFEVVSCFRRHECVDLNCESSSFPCSHQGAASNGARCVYGLSLRSREAVGLRLRCYSNYSVKRSDSVEGRKLSSLDGQDSAPWAHKFFIFKLRVIFQAVGCGFDSRLPLQVLAVVPLP